MPAAAKRLVAALLASIVISGAAAPSLQAEGETPMPCTLIGCSSGVGIEVTKVSRDVDRLTLCVQDRCKRIRFKHERPSGAMVPVECTDEITLLGVLTARDQDGRKLARYKELIPLKKHQPNGPECGPTCFWGGVRFNGHELIVVLPPARTA